MSQSDRPDLADVSELLHDHAPRLRDGELEAVKLRVLARAPKGPAMRSRLAITAALVAGLLMSSTGVALGISGISASGSAGDVEYVTPGQTTPQGNVPATNTPSSTPSTPSGPPENATPPEGTPPSIATPPRGAGAPSEVLAAEQSSSSPAREIPFTGFLAIPVLIIGVALLGTGLILRRRTTQA